MARGEFLSLLAILTIAHTLGTISVLTLSAVSPVAAQAYGVPAYMIGYQASLIATGIIVALVFGGIFPCAGARHGFLRAVLPDPG
jgi:hypothetical protein